jgi:uncharacterized protein (TIGR02246 family)
VTLTPLDTLEAQVAAWNRGDLDAFCASYTEEAVYVGASGPSRGRDALLASYRARYADRAAMGELSLVVDSLGVSGDHATAVVRWSVRSESGTVGGWALLVLADAGGRWLVTHDATLSSPRA